MKDPLEKRPFAIIVVRNGKCPEFYGHVPHSSYYIPRTVLIDAIDDLEPVFTFDRDQAKEYFESLRRSGETDVTLVAINSLKPQRLREWHDRRQAELGGGKSRKTIDNRCGQQLADRYEADQYFRRRRSPIVVQRRKKFNRNRAATPASPIAPRKGSNRPPE
jgi:hypothetical protein